MGILSSHIEGKFYPQLLEYTHFMIVTETDKCLLLTYVPRVAAGTDWQMSCDGM